VTPELVTDSGVLSVDAVPPGGVTDTSMAGPPLTTSTVKPSDAAVSVSTPAAETVSRKFVVAEVCTSVNANSRVSEPRTTPPALPSQAVRSGPASSPTAASKSGATMEARDGTSTRRGERLAFM
jgi:hypothetical protein